MLVHLNKYLVSFVAIYYFIHCGLIVCLLIGITYMLMVLLYEH